MDKFECVFKTTNGDEIVKQFYGNTAEKQACEFMDNNPGYKLKSGYWSEV
jgi:hypothetical protein